MFTVGEFSQLAQVSKRLLRYYDEIGLLKPNHTDPATGYRYYSADQMTHLNRILALKELGLSLDQISRMMSDHISTDEMQGMLLLKKAEIERQLQAELQRIRMIESRLQSIRDAESNTPLNVVIKQLPAQPILSTRLMVESFDHGIHLLRQIKRALPDKNGYGMCLCICHSHDLIDENMDLELGCFVEARSHALVNLNSGLQLHFRQLPPVETMATTVVKGSLETVHMGYREIGAWVEANGYRLAGIPREISLHLLEAQHSSDFVTEIQFPVEVIH